jgi:WD40 repeat protein
MTAIGSQFGSIPGVIEVVGLSASVWSDRISCIHFQDLQPRAVATTDATFAVGLSDKTIKIYSRSTCQEQQQFKSSQPPKLFAYSSSGKFLAVATIDFIEMYQPDSGLRLWQKRLRQDCLTVVFAQKDRTLRLIDKGGNLLSFSVADGSNISAFTLCDPIDTDESDSGFRRVFSSAAISIELNLIAAVQRGRPIGLYDLTEGDFYGPCRREFEVETQQTVDHAPLWIRSLVFSSLPEPSLLAALYHDGGIVVFDPYTTSVQAQTLTDCHHVLACSPDGRTLATGSGSGILQIFEFETLNLLYKIVAFDHSIRSITFTTDSLRMLDIRGSQCNIW